MHPGLPPTSRLSYLPRQPEPACQERHYYQYHRHLQRIMTLSRNVRKSAGTFDSSLSLSPPDRRDGILPSGKQPSPAFHTQVIELTKKPPQGRASFKCGILDGDRFKRINHHHHNYSRRHMLLRQWHDYPVFEQTAEWQRHLSKRRKRKQRQLLRYHHCQST